MEGVKPGSCGPSRSFSSVSKPLFLEGLLRKTQGKMSAITGLLCPSMFWAARVLQWGGERVEGGGGEGLVKRS